MDKRQQTEYWVRKSALEYFNENQKVNLKSSQFGASTSFRMPSAPQGSASGVANPPPNASTIGTRVGNYFDQVIKTPFRTKFRRFFGQEFLTKTPSVEKVSNLPDQQSEFVGNSPHGPVFRRTDNFRGFVAPKPTRTAEKSPEFNDYAVVDISNNVTTSTPKATRIPFDFPDGSGNAFDGDGYNFNEPSRYQIETQFEAASQGSRSFVRNLFDLPDGSKALDRGAGPSAQGGSPLDFESTTFEGETTQALRSFDRVATRGMTNQAWNLAQIEVGDSAPLQKLLDRYHEILGQLKMQSALNSAFGVKGNSPYGAVYLGQPQGKVKDSGSSFPDREKCGI